MRLVLASTNDFQFCERLYNDYDSDMIYRSFDAGESLGKAGTLSIEYFFDEETLAQISEELKLTQEKFNSEIEKDYNRFFIIYDENTPIGYFDLSLCYPNKPSKRKDVTNRWKLRFMCMTENNRSYETFSEAIRLLSKEKLMDEIDVCVIYESTASWFVRAGFEKIGAAGFYRRKKSS